MGEVSEPKSGITCYRCGRVGGENVVDPETRRCKRSCLARIKVGSALSGRSEKWRRDHL